MSSLSEAIAAYKLAYPKTKIRDKSLPLSISLDDEASCFEELANLLLPNVILAGLQVSVDGSNNLIVQPGIWQINRQVYQIDVPTTLALDTQAPTLSRYDVIYADTLGGINILSGDLSNAPIIPALPDDTILICTALITPTLVTIGTPFPTDYVDTVTNQNHIDGIKTFIKSPQVPDGVNPHDAVAFGQIGNLFGNGVGSIGGGKYGLAGSLSQNTTITTGAFSFGVIGRLSVSGAPVNPTDVLRLQDAYFPDGVVSGLGLSISGSNVIIAAGIWRISNILYTKTGSTTLALDAQDATLSRFDVIYGDNTGNLHLLSGTLALNPDVPSVPNGTILVGTVLITPTSVTNTPAPITDYVTLSTTQTIAGLKTINNKLIINSGTGQINGNTFTGTTNFISSNTGSGGDRFAVSINGAAGSGALNVTAGQSFFGGGVSLGAGGNSDTWFYFKSVATDAGHDPQFGIINADTSENQLGPGHGLLIRNFWHGDTSIFINGGNIYDQDGNAFLKSGGTITGFVPTTGGTMTGLLVLSADPTAALGAATKQYVDAAVSGSAVVFGAGQLSGAGTSGSPYLLGNTAITGQVLTGYSSTTGTVSTTDTILTAFGKLNGNQATYLLKSGGVMTGFLSLSADPTSALHAATKNYVDNLITGISWKQEVRAATTGNITLSATQTIDGVALIAGDRILVKDQTTQTENGIYIVAAGIWARSLDADTGSEIGSATVFVRLGTVNKDTQWTCTNSTDPVIGTDSITFGAISGGGTYANGTGITLSGNVFSLDQSFSKGLISATSPIFYNNTTGVISSQAATSSLNGYLTSTDWSTFNNKQPAGSYLTANQTITLSGDITGSGATAITTVIGSGKVTNAMLAGSIDLTSKVTGILPNGNTTATAAATANTIVSRDANANSTINNTIEGYTTTVTAAGTTTITVASTYQQFFTGTTTQTVLLPVVSTLVTGMQYLVVNNSTGAVTVQSSGANAIQVIAAASSAIFTCISITGTTAASWSVAYGLGTAFANPMTTLGDIIYGGASGAATRLAGNTATSTLFLTSVGSAGVATAPAYFDLFGTANTFSTNQTVQKNNILTTVTDGLALLNTTASTSGATRQISPSFRLGGHLWSTTSTASDRWVDWIQYVDMTSGTNSTFSSTLHWQASHSTTSTPSYSDIMTLDKAGTLTVNGLLVAIGGINVGGVSGTTNSNFSTSSGSSFSGGGSTAASLLFGTASTVCSRTFFSGLTANTVAAGNSYGAVIVGRQGANIAVSGTHEWFANLVVTPLGTIGGSGATLTNTATLLIDGAGTGGTNNYALAIRSGNIGILTAPSTSAATYDVLTRNSSSGVVEKVLSTTLSWLVASADLTAQTAAVTSLATYTVGASTGTFRVGGYVNITAVTLDVIQFQCTFTDETNTAQTLVFYPMGATAAGLSTTGFNALSDATIRCKNGTAIILKTVLTTGTGSITYDVGGQIQQLR